MNLEKLQVHKSFIVNIPNGVHARPAARITQILQNSHLESLMVYKSAVIETSSMLEILELNIPHGARLDFFFNQEDVNTFKLLAEIFEQN